MNSEMMRELYQEMILGHNKSPRNKGELPDADATQEGFNPLCGDRVTIAVKFNGEEVEQVMFDGHGCAIDTASASMMTEIIKGKSKSDAEAIIKEFLHLVLRDGEADMDLLGKLKVFAGVGEFPARVKCATLPWHTLRAALAGGNEVVSTE